MTEHNKGLEVRGLSLKLPLFTIQADFSVESNERVALTGRSGVGKTTLLRALAGLHPLTAEDKGQILLFGEDLTRVPTHRRRVGYLFQTPSLIEHLNVQENIALPLRLRGVERQPRAAESLEWLRKIYLADRSTENIQVLSGGERQRVALAQTLAARPRLLLLDEPFSALDPDLRKGLRSLVLELLEETKIPAILVSHQEEDVAAFAQRRFNFQERDGGRTRVLST